MISQGIGRRNIQTFEPMGKIQMSKGEPLKLSTTNFVFCAQSSRSWLGKVNAWGREEYGSQIRIWEDTHFWKTCFLLLGKVNAWKWMPKLLFTHVFHSSPILIHVGAPELFPSCCFGCFLIPQLGKSVFGIVQWMGRGDSRSRGF